MKQKRTCWGKKTGEDISWGVPRSLRKVPLLGRQTCTRITDLKYALSIGSLPAVKRKENLFLTSHVVL